MDASIMSNLNMSKFYKRDSILPYIIIPFWQ